MMRFLRFITILLLGVAGFSSCGAVASSSLVEEGGDMLQVKPKRYNYSLGGEFNKNNDLAVSLYHPETGFSPVSMEEVDVKVGGDTADPSVFFEDLTNDEKYWPVTVRYADMDPVQYTITVGTPKGPNSGDPSGPTIVITGGIEIKIGWE